MNEILEKIRQLRNEVDVLYEMSCRSKAESDQYCNVIDKDFNELIGLCMSYAVKKKESE